VAAAETSWKDQSCQDILTDVKRNERHKTNALHHIRRQVSVVRDAQDELELFIARAQHWGATWAEIADALGVTRQSAHQRYRRLRYDPTEGIAWHEPPHPD
jgi:hypothetical protein